MRDFPARKSSKSIEMRTWLGSVDSIVIPSVRAGEICVQVVFVDAAMKRIRAALRDHLNLAARPTGEVRCLVCRRDLEHKQRTSPVGRAARFRRSEEHTSELQSPVH